MTSTSVRSSKSGLRTRARQYRDGLLGKLLGLPPSTTDYTVERGLRVPMRDGVELLADHYTPTGEPVGTILLRGPYGRGFPFSTLYARPFAQRGYHVVFQSVRGTFGSGGEFEPVVNEVADGADTVAWLRDQPWFTGSFATIGLSYLGFTQWALLRDPPPEMAAAVIAVGPHDFGSSSWGTGTFALNDFLGWCDLVAHQEKGRLRVLIATLTARRRLAGATSGLPLSAAGRALLGEQAPWYQTWLAHPNPEDPFWEPFRFDEVLDCVDIPVLLLGGWQDLFLEQTLEQYRRLRRRGAPVELTVGPWTHSQLVTSGAGPVARETLRWLDRHVAGTQPTQPADPVRLFIKGHGWMRLPDWPPASSERVLYPGPDETMTDNPPPPASPRSAFTFDPADPTPTIGGRLLAPEGGYRVDNRLAERADVLAFTTEPLAEDWYLEGPPVLELAHAADNPNVDLFVRISEVDSKGRSRNVSESYRRLGADTEPTVVRIQLDTAAHRFPAGSRIRLLIAGGSHPRYARNTGTGESPATAWRLVSATHVIHHGSGGVSRLILPTTARRPSPNARANKRNNLP